MTHPWDDFSKSLAESVPRRESLRRLGAVIASAVLSPLGLETASAGPKLRGAGDPCHTFCKCRSKKQQDQCLKVCHACQSDTSRVCGKCGNYVCCAAGQRCCSGHCTSLQNDVLNCGACGRNCGAPGAIEFVACVAGLCTYDCVPGTVDCNGTCTFLEFDPANCGACANVCPDSAPTCDQGTCTDVVCPGGGTLCFGLCTNISFDPSNCGGCGIVCAADQTCSGGICQYPF
jgi:hypothetical protein